MLCVHLYNVCNVCLVMLTDDVSAVVGDTVVDWRLFRAGLQCKNAVTWLKSTVLHWNGFIARRQAIRQIRCHRKCCSWIERRLVFISPPYLYFYLFFSSITLNVPHYHCVFICLELEMIITRFNCKWERWLRWSTTRVKCVTLMR